MKTRNARIMIVGAALLTAWVTVPGCVADHEPAPGAADATGTAIAAINNVPNDGTVACIAITSTGSWSTTQSFDVLPGDSTTFTLNGIPTGTVRFDGSAYSTACSLVTPSSVPTWVSTPVLASVVIGQVTPISLNLHQVGSAGIGVGFNPEPACRSTGLPCLGNGECCSAFCASDNTCQPAPGCGPGQMQCGPSSCANLANDPLNCGTCGHVCPMGAVCVGGACFTPPGCGPGLVQCGPSCVDIMNDAQNCGACGSGCAPGFGCLGGACAPCADAGACMPTAVCGDGIVQVQGGETCDDGNTISGDGCSAGCMVEPGAVCFGQPSTCTGICGDGIVGPGEQCDDGNAASFDGCSKTCQLETPTCTDGLKNGTETDLDCGGVACPPCAAGKNCATASDCLSGICLVGICH